MVFLPIGMVRAGGDRAGPRGRSDIERERRELYERTAREVDRIVAEAHDKLPRHAAKTVGAVYCRYSTRHQDSISDQVRKILEDAVRRKVFVPRDLVLYDMAVRGCKSQRAGLDQLRQLLHGRKVGVVMFFATNRLFRKIHRTLQFVEEEIVERGIDAVFVKSGVDTSDTKRWRMLLTFHSMMDEFVVGMYTENIRAAHEGLLERRLVFGTVSYGYSGEPIDGETNRSGRPRRRLIINPLTSVIVGRVFAWYVVDRLSIGEIIRRLNDDQNVPLPPRCTSGQWTRLAVRRLLTNPRYRGFWQYGVTELVWISSKDYARQIARREPLKEIQLEELRIVSDQIWFEAQKRLADDARNGGRRPQDGDRRSRPKFLNGLVWCPEHNRPLQIGGAHGRYLFCPSCRRLKSDRRCLCSLLNRALALRLTCEKLAELVNADEGLVQQVIQRCRRAVESLRRPDPARIEQLTAQDEQLTRRIRFVMDHVGDTDEDRREAEVVLKKSRQQRAEIRAEIASLQDSRGKQVQIPSEEETRGFLNNLSSVVASAARGDLGDETGRLRAIISQLTGGRIELAQMGERRAQRGWLQGRFQVNIVSVVVSELTGVRPTGNDGELAVMIDYRASRLIDEQAEEAKRLWDQDLLNKEIARQMGRSQSYVCTLLNHWFASRGLERPDGRKRRASLENKQVRTPAYKGIADEAVRLADDGKSDLAIARRFNVSHTTVAKAVKFWHTSHDLPVPTARDRRLRMLRRAKEMFDQGMLIRDIAAHVGYTPRGLGLALEQYLAELGESMPDGRARRGNANSGQRACGHAVRNGVAPVSDR